ncbi:anti-sigma factor [Mycolicibacterium sp. CBMA 226]|uniref:anti-sigma factor n=1 Tax=Mycolicibacterium sp. CBMA 226 TaxID=2606611 RepID=UPI0012DDE896|nr:anti-sigma factor [Mycolicibacterium sp. CBMA 226]MUL76903.1 anti-sigma factor [Mycolicibacterium sp. CBMA 226]
MPDSYTDDEQQLLDLAYVYALDAVSEAERSEIAGRLGVAAPHTAQEFGRIVGDTQETMALVTAGDAMAPPAELRVRILQAIGIQPAGDSPDELALRRIRRRRLIVRVVAAAAAVCAIVIGTSVVAERFTNHPEQQTVSQVLANPDIRTFSAEVAGGTITLSASQQANAVVVAMSNVPAPPAGHVYQMWFIPASGAPRSAGTMSADTMPPPGGEVIPALNSAAKVAVTVEPGTGSSQPTSTPVVVVSLT